MIRVQSNIVIILWICMMYLNTSKFSDRILSTISISIYLILNLLFIFQISMMNSNSGDYRIALVKFVIITVVLVFVQANQLKTRGKI